VPKGEWNENITYEMLDLVNHNGYAWLAKRTVVGIEPSDSHPEYWHNMLDINKIVSEAIASTLAVEVSELLKDELSEARYTTDLLAEVDVPTFVYWNTETANTPFTEGLTSISHGYALVEGDTLTAWADGEEFIYGANGWDKAITSSGGTMSGPLGLGGGTGSVSADEEGAFLEASESENSRKVSVSASSSLEEAVKFITKEGDITEVFRIIGEHNPDLISELGYARVEFGTHIGKGGWSATNADKITFKFEPKVVIMASGGSPMIAFRGANEGAYWVINSNGISRVVKLRWEANDLYFYSGDKDDLYFSKEGSEYPYVAFG
jgi:hypothetical protein